MTIAQVRVSRQYRSVIKDCQEQLEQLAGGMGITENITKRWLRQTLVVERGIAVSYKYNPLASVPVPEICVPVLCSRAQKVAVIVIKRKCRLIPDLPAPVAQLFVPGGSVDIMTNDLSS